MNVVEKTVDAVFKLVVSGTVVEISKVLWAKYLKPRGIRIPPILAWTLAFLLMICVYLVLNHLGGFTFKDKPTVSISTPVNGDKITVKVTNTGSGMIVVSGQSTDLEDGWQIYLAIRHVESPGYYLQLCCPEAVTSDGSWQATGWYGGKRFPPKVGDNIEIVAIAREVVLAKEHLEPWMEKNLDKFNPKARSSPVRITVGAVDGEEPRS
jgi:hypothetical protein